MPNQDDALNFDNFSDILFDIAADTLTGNSADILTDVLLDTLTNKLVSHYSQAATEINKKADTYFSKYLKEDAEKRKTLTEEQYRAWQNSILSSNKYWQDMRDTLAEDLTHSNEIAAGIINDNKCDIYSLNHNYGTYEIEHNVGIGTSYSLYDHNTVEKLIAENPQLLPKYQINTVKDITWNVRNINSAITQGILQGESIENISKRLQSVVDMNKNSAIKNARTATTCAQNAGRVDSYARAIKMGINVKQQWISTLDGRTRHTHRSLMGQIVDVGKPFVTVDGNKLRFPGDPHGEAYEVYNCRCTVVAAFDDDYDVSKIMEENLSKKGMTIDEWIDEQPLSKHYGETKKEYLTRYKAYKQQQTFKNWLEDQAMPDELIQKTWGNKKMSQIYNEIKAHNVTDANKFYKELGKLGKPSEVWQNYLTGQLDAEDLQKFESILKKYLPTVAAAADDTVDAIKAIKNMDAWSDTAKKAHAGISWKQGEAMSLIDADNYHVNPNYKGPGVGAYGKNCQTCSYVYEARRQGYDVVALGFDPKAVDVVEKQVHLSMDAGQGWINTTTGKAPKRIEYHGPPNSTHMNHSNDMVQFLDNNIQEGQRHILSIQWKTGESHQINIERTNGILRIIDNQRGPGEKNTWIGAEIDEYLEHTKHVKYVVRVDDCVPNPEYFNVIAKSAKKKATVSVTAVTSSPAKSTIDLDALKNKKVTGIYNEIKTGVGSKEANQFYNELKKIGQNTGIGKQGDVWKKYLEGTLDADSTAKIDKYLTKKYSKVVAPAGPDFSKYKKMTMSQALNDVKADGNYGKLYKQLVEMGGNAQKPSDVWNAYIKGQLNPTDAAKIEKFLKGGTSTTKTVATVADNTKELEAAKKELEAAKKEFEKVKKTAPANKVYTGIWKDDVTLADYEIKKDKIAAKKAYYEDEIQKLKETQEHLQYIGEDLPAWEKNNLTKFQNYLEELDEFEKLGPNYAKYQKEVDKANAAVRAVQDKVTKLSPASEMYTQERKNAAKWYTQAQYCSGDVYYSKQAKPVHATATSSEHAAYYGYTSASGSYNRPLAGFKAPRFSGASGWDEKYYRGVGKVDLNNEGSGKKIRDLTTFIEKSKMKDDVWVQTAQNFATLEGRNGFLGIPYGTLQSMSDADLQQFVGIENQLGQFISGSINRGGGSYTPGNMVLNIYCPEGSEALYVLSDGAFGKAEHEIILQRGGSYRITKMYWGQDVEKGGRKLFVDMELRLERGYNKYGQ